MATLTLKDLPSERMADQRKIRAAASRTTVSGPSHGDPLKLAARRAPCVQLDAPMEPAIAVQRMKIDPRSCVLPSVGRVCVEMARAISEAVQVQNSHGQSIEMCMAPPCFPWLVQCTRTRCRVFSALCVEALRRRVAAVAMLD